MYCYGSIFDQKTVFSQTNSVILDSARLDLNLVVDDVDLTYLMLNDVDLTDLSVTKIHAGQNRDKNTQSFPKLC